MAITFEDSNCRGQFTVSTNNIDFAMFSNCYIFSRFPIIRPIAATTGVIMLLYLTRSTYNKFKEKQLSRQKPIPTISMTIKERKNGDIPLEPIPSTGFANINKLSCPQPSTSKASYTGELQNQEPSTTHQSE